MKRIGALLLCLSLLLSLACPTAAAVNDGTIDSILTQFETIETTITEGTSSDMAEPGPEAQPADGPEDPGPEAQPAEGPEAPGPEAQPADGSEAPEPEDISGEPAATGDAPEEPAATGDAPEEPVRTAPIWYVAGGDVNGDTRIYPQLVNETCYLFLPASADLNALVLNWEGGEALLRTGESERTIAGGEPFSLAGLFSEETRDSYPVTFVLEDRETEITIMRSANIGSMYLTSADAEKDRHWVELDKNNKPKNNQMVLLRPDGSTVYDGTLKNMKGRGNSTWHLPKRPYQIKLSKAADLLETGDPAEAETTWVLLADYLDKSLMHNRLTFDLAAELGLPYIPHSKSVDLYYDGEYRGTYELCEKTEVGDGRVAVRDLEAEIEKANPDVDDMDELERVLDLDEFGNQYQYVSGLILPEDFDGGYLLEMDFGERAVEEASWFSTGNGTYVVCKSPEYLPAEGVLYISSLYRHFEDAVVNGGTDPATGKDFTEFVDLDSLVRCYLMLELSACVDSYKSSTYFYKPAGEDKLYAGPLWDFDQAYGTGEYYISYNETVTGYAFLGRALPRLEAFRDAALPTMEQLAELVSEIAVSDDAAMRNGRLMSIAGYGAELDASRRMNNILWPTFAKYSTEDVVQDLQSYLYARSQWLNQQIAMWPPGKYVDVRMEWYFDDVTYVTDNDLFEGVSSHMFRPTLPLSRAMFVTVLHRLAGSPDAENSAGFTDVDPEEWYADAVDWAVETGIAKGYPDNIFYPDEAISREQLITMLFRYAAYMGYDVSGTAELTGFPDADLISDYAAEAMTWAINRGVIQGTELGLLVPQGNVPRAHAAAVFHRVHLMWTHEMPAPVPESESEPAPESEPVPESEPAPEPEPASVNTF